MQIKDSRFHKVWEVEKDDYGNTKLNLGDSKKNQDGTYTNWSWFGCKLVGNAKQFRVSKGDTINIKSGVIEMRQCSDGVYRPFVVIFDIEHSSNQQQGNNQSRNVNDYNPNNDPRHNGNNYPSGNFENDIPF